MTSPTYTVEPRDPNDVEDDAINTSKWLKVGETIVEHSVTSADPAFVISNVALEPGLLRWRTSGGVAGRDYLVIALLRANTGRRIERTIRYPIRQL